MIQWWINLKVRNKLLMAGLLLTILPVAAVILTVRLENGNLIQVFDVKNRELAMQTLDATLDGIYMSCKQEHESMLKYVNYALGIERNIVAKYGRTALGEETVQWQAVNQANKQSRAVVLPQMTVGGQWLGMKEDPAVAIPVVDEVRENKDITATIFQRMDAQGNMLRVCTSVIDKSGKRAIGTYIPASSDSGERNKVISTVLNGEIYRGRAFVVDAWYITAYEPIFDTSRNVIGMLYVGVKQETSSLYRQVARIRYGKTGYAFVLNAKGDERGAYVISKDNQQDGENLWDKQDSDGVYFIREICSKALTLQGGAKSEQRYPWLNPGESKARMKVARITYFEPWDWVISMGAYEDEMKEMVAAVHAASNKTQVIIAMIGIIGIAIAVFAWLFIARGIAEPVSKAVHLAETIRNGDISKRLKVESRDEIGTLSKFLNEMADAISGKVELAETIADGDLTQEVHVSSNQDTFGKSLKKMAENLHEMIHQAKMTVEQVAVGSGEVSTASQALSQGATSQAASIEEITSSVTELSSQTKTNAENATQANQLSKVAREAAVNGTKKMNEMQHAMNAIQTSSKDIEKIIKVIDDIAFQTNLLALNAAVEAARAGKHGKGFAVVAEEVRSLAGRSAKAAKETGELISDSMRKVENGIDVANATVDALSLIENGVTKVTDLVAEIAASSNEQAQGISQINQGLHQIDSVTQRNTSSAEETASAAEELSSQSEQLRKLLMQFKIRSGGQPIQMYQQSTAMETPHEGLGESLGWGGGSSPVVAAQAAGRAKPESVIALDDSDFGQY